MLPYDRYGSQWRKGTGQHAERIYLACVAMAFGLPVFAGDVKAEWAVVTDGRVAYMTHAFQFSSARRARFSEDPSLPPSLR